MRRVTIKRSADGGIVQIRAGDRVLGQVSGLASQSDVAMTGTFTHHPAYADLAPEFQALARAVADGDAEATARLRASLEAAGAHVWHTSHDMRIDRPQTLVVADGKATFAPNDAFHMMRTGGLG